MNQAAAIEHEMSVPVVRVPFIYGGYYWVSQADLDNPRKVQLPLYTRDGKKWEDTPAGRRAVLRHEATTLIRGNIGHALPD